MHNEFAPSGESTTESAPATGQLPTANISTVQAGVYNRPSALTIIPPSSAPAYATPTQPAIISTPQGPAVIAQPVNPGSSSGQAGAVIPANLTPSTPTMTSPLTGAIVSEAQYLQDVATIKNGDATTGRKTMKVTTESPLPAALNDVKKYDWQMIGAVVAIIGLVFFIVKK